MTEFFLDHEKTTKEYLKKLEEKYSTSFNWEQADPSNVYEMIHDKALDFYELEELMEYNFHLSFLANMYQIFEQQLRSFAYRELNQNFSPVRTQKFEEFGLNWNEIKESYQHLGYILEMNSHWDKIKILGDITNTFKHGYGRSAKRLFKKHPEMFKSNSFNNERILDRELTTNFKITLEITAINFDSYADSLIGFWNEFPNNISGTYTFKE